MILSVYVARGGAGVLTSRRHRKQRPLQIFRRRGLTRLFLDVAGSACGDENSSRQAAELYYSVVNKPRAACRTLYIVAGCHNTILQHSDTHTVIPKTIRPSTSVHPHQSISNSPTQASIPYSLPPPAHILSLPPKQEQGTLDVRRHEPTSPQDTHAPEEDFRPIRHP